MKRAFIFLIVFIGVIAGIYLLVLGTNFSAWQTLRENQKGMAEGAEFVEKTYSLKSLTTFIAQQPQFVSITSFDIQKPDSGIYYQSDVPRTLGTTANIFLLIEFERQVAEGILDPNKTVPLDEIKNFTLPEISQNSHENFLESIDGDRATLNEIMAKTIESNDLAASDYLWFLLGEENIRNLVDSLGFPNESMPLPFSGMYISINPVLNDTSGFSSEKNTDFQSLSIEFARRLNEDQTFRNKVLKQFNEDRLSLTFIQERDALKFFPQATTLSLTRLMASLLKGEIISDEISDRVIEKLRWPMETKIITSSFENYGAIYEDRMGLLGGIDFGTSKYDGHTSVQAVYFDRLPVAFWMHMSSNHMNKDFQQRLIWDPVLYETMINEIRSLHE